MRERETATEIEKKLKEASKTVKRGFDNLVKEMKSGHTDRYLDYLSFVSRFHRYSHFNQMLIFSQKPDATLVAGYRKWQEMGYQVNRGERGIKILAPIFVKQEEAAQLMDNLMSDELGATAPELHQNFFGATKKTQNIAISGS